MDINKLMKQAQAMQKKMVEMQENIAKQEYEGTAGGGLVTVKVTGKGDLINLKIDPKLIDPEEKEMLEDLIVAAFNDAKKKADANANDAMGGLTAGLPGGFKMPF